MVIQGVTYPSDFEAKKAMIELGRRLDAKGYAVAGDGSLSMRVGPNAVWITEAGADKAALTQETFVRIDRAGKQMMSAHPRILPDDLPIHLKVYAENPELKCVLHAYPARVTVLAVRGQGLEAAGFSPAVRALGRVMVLQAAKPGMEAAADAAALRCKTENAVILPNDGCMVWGKTAAAALHFVEALDYCAEVSAALGGGSGCGGRACSACAGCKGACAQGTAPQVPTAAPAPAAPPCEGLTPLIRPGETDSFVLPAGQSAPPPPRPTALQPAPPAQPAPLPAQTAAAPESDVRREQVMAEVVRRMMANL